MQRSRASQVMYLFHSKLCLFVIFWYIASIHTYMHACMHTCTFIGWLHFFQRYVFIMHIYIYICVSCVIFMFSRKHIQAAEVLSVRFPKEYDHINLAAKHPKLCTNFILYPVYFLFNSYIHTYIHTCIHTYMHAYT